MKTCLFDIKLTQWVSNPSRLNNIHLGPRIRIRRGINIICGTVEVIVLAARPTYLQYKLEKGGRINAFLSDQRTWILIEHEIHKLHERTNRMYRSMHLHGLSDKVRWPIMNIGSGVEHGAGACRLAGCLLRRGIV